MYIDMFWQWKHNLGKKKKEQIYKGCFIKKIWYFLIFSELNELQSIIKSKNFLLYIFE